MPGEVRLRNLELQIGPDDLRRIESALVTQMRDVLEFKLIAPQRVDEILWNAKATKSAELIREIDGDTIKNSKEILYCLLSSEGTYAEEHSLALSFPEISFVDVKVLIPSPEEKMLLPDLTGIAERIARFILGERAWFDLRGARRQERERICSIQVPNARCATSARIVEDESDYANLLGYVALRSGLFDHVDVIRSEAGLLWLLQECRSGNGQDRGVLLHAWEYAFADHSDPADPSGQESGQEGGKAAFLKEKSQLWLDLARDTGLWRSTVSSASLSEIHSIIAPRNWRGEPEAIGLDVNQGRVRGVKKPLGWIHDLLSSGLFEFRSGSGLSEKSLYTTAFGLEPPTDFGTLPESHSATGKAQSFAQALLTRARQALNEGEPIFSAIMALEAIRLLRGRSVTLFLDAIMTLYVSEANIETRLACATHGGREPIRRRAQELDEIAGWLTRNQLADERMLRDQTVRIWLALRNIYQQAGAFDAADEILLQVHRSEYEIRWPVRSIRSSATDNETSFLEKLKRKSRECLNAGCSFLESLRNARGPLGRFWRGIVWLSLPLACAILLLFTERAEGLRLLDILFLTFMSIAAIFWGPDIFRYPGKTRFLFLMSSTCGFIFSYVLFQHLGSSHVRNGLFVVPRADLGIAAVTFLGLVWILTKGPDGIGWLALAIMPSRWVYAVGFSILLLAAANVSTFRRVGDSSVPLNIRAGEAPLSLAWTTGQMLGVNAPQKARPTNSGHDVVDNDTVDGFHLDQAPVARYPLWFENVLTGWALFALGLSSIYRKATRG